MAAHPFGPIEKFLVVAHKSPGFDPSKVKIGYWQEKLVKIPDPVTDPVWAFAATDAENFSVEPTAIVNSRDYEVRFKGGFSGQDLLSRGLGYRITFTMPADREFDVSLPTTWPQIEIKFLDCFGTKILGTLDKITKQNHLLNVGNFLRNEARLVECLLGFQTVEIESTFLGLKITENSVTETHFPSFTTDSSPLSVDLAQKLELYKPLISLSKVSTSFEVFQNLIPRLKALAKYLSGNHGSPHSNILKGYFCEIATFFAELALTNVDVEMPTELLTQLQSSKHDLGLWLANTGQFPSYFDEKFIEAVLKHQKQASFSFEDGPTEPRANKPEETRNLIWHKLPRFPSLYLLDFGKGLTRLVLHTVKLELEAFGSRKQLNTKHFTVIEHERIKFREIGTNSLHEHHLFELEDGDGDEDEDCRVSLTHVVPHYDLAILKFTRPAKGEHDSDYERIVVVDIKKAAVIYKSDLIHVASQRIYLPFETGMFLDDEGSYGRFEFLPYNCNVEGSSQTISTVPLDFQSMFCPTGECVRLSTWLGQCRYSHTFFAIYWDETTPTPKAATESEGRWCFFRFDFNVEEQSFEIGIRGFFGYHGQNYSSYEAGRLLEYNAFWIQDKKGRMFGGINYSRRYSEKPLSKTLFVVVYHKKRFVPIGPQRLGGCVTVSCLNAIKKYDIASEIALMLPKVTDKDGAIHLKFRTLKLRY